MRKLTDSVFDEAGREIKQAPTYRGDPVIWRKTPSNPVVPVLCVGEVAILSGAPGIGRREVSLALAAAGAGAQSGPRQACGLTVRPGPAMLIDYGASAEWLMQWFDATGHGKAAQRVGIWANPVPIFESCPRAGCDTTGPALDWKPIFADIQKFEPSLLVVNGIGAAISDFDPWDRVTILAGLNVLWTQARLGDYGTLIVAEDGKAARAGWDLARGPGADVVAGNRAWFDWPQAIVHMRQQGNRRTMACVTSSSGPAGWKINLIERAGVGGFSRFEVVPNARNER